MQVANTVGKRVGITIAVVLGLLCALGGWQVLWEALAIVIGGFVVAVACITFGHWLVEGTWLWKR